MVEFASIEDTVFRELAIISICGDMLYNSQFSFPVEVVKSLRQYQLMFSIGLPRARVHLAVLDAQFRGKTARALN